MKQTLDPLRILILTSGTGGGHNARAYAVHAWVKKLYGKSVQITIEEILENASFITRFGVAVYNSIQRDAPSLHHLYWWIVEGFGRLNSSPRFIGHRYYHKLLARFNPDLVLSLHDATNKGYFDVLKKTKRLTKIPCVTYCGEFSGGYGYSQNWISKYSDRFYSRTQDARKFAESLHAEIKESRVFQNLLPPEVFHDQMSEPEKKAFRLTSLGLDPDRFTIFLTSGGVGANHHLHFLEILTTLANNVQAIIICGKNKSSYAAVNAWARRNPQLKLYSEGYSDHVHKLIQVSDAIVSRGGSNTAAEALFYQCPIIFDCLSGTMPQESLTVRYFLKYGAAKILRKKSELKSILEDWINFSTDYQKTKENLARIRSEEMPSGFIQELVELAEWGRSRKLDPPSPSAP